MSNEFDVDGALYLVLNPNLSPVQFISIVRKAGVFMISEDPDRFGVIVGMTPSGEVFEPVSQADTRFGVGDVSQFRFTDDVVDDPVTCVPILDNIPEPLREQLVWMFDTILLEDGRRAIVAGYAKPFEGEVEARVTHEHRYVIDASTPSR